jgi:hypothetical protein
MFSVADAQNANGNYMFMDIANDPVWSNTIFPETGHIFPKGIAKTTGVIIRGDSIP